MALVMVFTSCTDEDGITRIPMEPGPAEILSPNGSTTYNLIEENEGGAFETFIWEAAYFGAPAEVSYEVEVDLASGDFSTPESLGTTTETYLTITTSAMNQVIRDLGVMAEEEVGLQVRIISTSGSEEKISIPVSMLVKRYIYDDEIPVWKLKGSAMAEMIDLVFSEDDNVWKTDGAVALSDGTFNFFNDNVYKNELGATTDLVYAPMMEGDLTAESFKAIPVKDFDYFVTLDVENMTFKVEEDNFYSLTGTAVNDETRRFEKDGSNYSMKTRLSVGSFNVLFNATTPVVYGATAADDYTLIENGLAIDISKEGDYVLTIDENMVLTVEEALFPDNLYLVGSATAYGWDTPGTKADANFHKLAGGDDNAGIYWKIAHLEGGQGFKISNTGWSEPNVGFGQVTEFDVNGVTVSDDGGNMKVVNSGMYTIVIDIRGGEIKVSVTEVKVYGMGDAFGGWDENSAANLFTVDNTAKTVTSPAIPADGNIRSYVDHEWIPGWWQAEFVPNSGVIHYRNDGGDPPAIGATAGQVITYTFDDNTCELN